MKVTTVPYMSPPALALTEQQLRELADARVASKKIRTAINVARFDAWTVAIFAGLSLVCGITSVTGVLVGLGMAAVAVTEFIGLSMLKRLDVRAAKLLGFNQLGLALVLILYATWCIYSELSGAGMLSSAMSSEPMVAQMLEPYRPMERLITYAIYGTLIAVAVFAQGGTALFYFTRAKHIQRYVEQTPAWILQMQRAGVSF
jgi:hypothetical protein